MKKIFLLLFILPFFVQAQECNIKKELDSFTQLPKITTGFVPFSAGIDRTLISIDANNKEIDYFFTLNSEKCFDNSSNVVLVFEGGRLKSNFKNTGSMNCQGLFHITFKNAVSTPSILQRMATKKVVSIQFLDTAGKAATVELKENEQEQFMNMSACAIAEAKKLLP